MVLPGCDDMTTGAVAERIVSNLQQTTCEALGRPVTVSVGGVPAAPGRDAESIIAEADANLYRAKEQGRNRVVLSRCMSDLGPDQGQLLQKQSIG